VDEGLTVQGIDSVNTLFTDCQSNMNGHYTRHATTLSGRAVYKHDTSAMYLYYDFDCATGFQGAFQGENRWIFDDIEPSTTAKKDLTGDGWLCDHIAFFKVNAFFKPASGYVPAGTNAWEVSCGMNQPIEISISITLDPELPSVTPHVIQTDIDGCTPYNFSYGWSEWEYDTPVTNNYSHCGYWERTTFAQTCNNPDNECDCTVDSTLIGMFGTTDYINKYKLKNNYHDCCVRDNETNLYEYCFCYLPCHTCPGDDGEECPANVTQPPPSPSPSPEITPAPSPSPSPSPSPTTNTTATAEDKPDKNMILAIVLSLVFVALAGTLVFLFRSGKLFGKPTKTHFTPLF